MPELPLSAFEAPKGVRKIGESSSPANLKLTGPIAERPNCHASNSLRRAKTLPNFLWCCLRTGRPSLFSQSWTVRTSRPKNDAISFHESSRLGRLRCDLFSSPTDVRAPCIERLPRLL